MPAHHQTGPGDLVPVCVGFGQVSNVPGWWEHHPRTGLGNLHARKNRVLWIAEGCGSGDVCKGGLLRNIIGEK